MLHIPLVCLCHTKQSFFLLIFKHLLWHEFYSKVKPRTIFFPLSSLFLGHRFSVWLLEAPLDWIPQLADAAQKKKKKKNSENWAPNPITQDAVFQCLSDTPLSKSSTLCVKSIPSVWRICAPVGIVVQTHAGVYDALGRQKCFLPLSYLLNQSPPHVLLFQFVCAPKHLSHTFSSGTALWLQQWNASAQKVSPCLLRIANLLLDTFLQVCAATVQKKFSSFAYFCIVYAVQNVNSYIRRLRVGCFLSCLRCSSKLLFSISC